MGCPKCFRHICLSSAYIGKSCFQCQSCRHSRNLMDSFTMNDSRELRRKVAELSVLESELSTIGKSSKIYKQQPNSQVFFLHDKTLMKNEVHESLKNLQKQLKEIEK